MFSEMNDEIVIYAKRSDYTRKSIGLDYYSIDVVMRDSGNPRQENTEKLILNLYSNNDNPHSAGTKNIQVYNYKVQFQYFQMKQLYHTVY